MSPVGEFAREDTRRTVLAETALEVSGQAKAGVAGVKKTVRHMKWIWAAIVLVGAIFGGGYVARDRVDHFATNARVDVIDVNQHTTDRKVDLLIQAVESLREQAKREADNFDDLNKFIRERSHGR